MGQKSITYVEFLKSWVFLTYVELTCLFFSDSCRISKIFNFRPIDLEFEEALHIRSLNSTSNYLFLGFRKYRALRDDFLVWLSVSRISQNVLNKFR